MKTCPHCNCEIRVNELPHPGMWKDYRVCPDCGGKFTVDRSTKRLQLICIFLALISLALTLLLYYDGPRWIIPAGVSYLVLGTVIYIGNKRLRFVACEEED